MDPDKPLPGSETEAFVHLLDLLLSVSRDKIQSQLSHRTKAKAAAGTGGEELRSPNGQDI
jgi:hypothetical protein